MVKTNVWEQNINEQWKNTPRWGKGSSEIRTHLSGNNRTFNVWFFYSHSQYHPFCTLLIPLDMKNDKAKTEAV